MKNLWINGALFFIAHTIYSSGLEIKIEPNWHYLDNDNIKTKIPNANKNWIFAATIFIKKRIEGPVVLDKLVLAWKGNCLDSLLGSLYRKKPGRRFLPLEDYVICDSIWNKKEQKLIYKFDRPISLETQTELCLVLTVPNDLENIIKSGQFELMQDELPLLVTQELNAIQQPILVFKVP